MGGNHQKLREDSGKTMLKILYEPCIDSSNGFSIKLHDKGDDLYFHIVNFPFLSSNISSGLHLAADKIRKLLLTSQLF